MEHNYCRDCAYALHRDEPKVFKWCEYFCTHEDYQNGHIPPYRMAQNTCEHFLATQGPQKG